MSGSAHAKAAARHGGNPVLRIIGWISQVCGVVAALMIVASVLIVCQMIFIRFVLNQSTIWHTEGVTYLMIGATTLLNDDPTVCLGLDQLLRQRQAGQRLTDAQIKRYWAGHLGKMIDRAPPNVYDLR